MALIGFVIIWRYQVRAGSEARFIKAYGPQGDWAALFSRAPGFLGTRLSRDTEDAASFVTLDFWESEEAFEIFRSQCSSEYSRLDKEMEALTEAEERLGSFRTAKKYGA